MNIAIISEMDSRNMIYPAMQILSHFGKVGVVSTRRSLRRLIDGDNVGTFCGIEIDTDDDPSSVPEADYVLYDNTGVDKADLIIAVVGAAISEQFAYDLELIIQNPAAHVLKFGKPVPQKNAPKEKKKPGEETPEFATQLTMEEQLIRVLTSKKSKWLPIITTDELENLEALHKWPKLNMPLAQELFRIIGTQLCPDEHMFMKEVQTPNENSIDINPLYIG